MLKNCLIVLMLFPLILNIANSVHRTVLTVAPSSWISTLLFNWPRANDIRSHFDLIIDFTVTITAIGERFYALMMQFLILLSALVVLKKNITKTYFRTSLVVVGVLFVISTNLCLINSVSSIVFLPRDFIEHFREDFQSTITDGSLDQLSDYMNRSRCCGFYINYDLTIGDEYYPSICNSTKINRGCYQAYLANYGQEHKLFGNVYFQMNFFSGFLFLMQGFATVFAVILYKNKTYPLPPRPETIETPTESVVEINRTSFRHHSDTSSPEYDSSD